MKTLNVTIELDPVNDGAEIINAIFRRKDEGALIIATNGDHSRPSLPRGVPSVLRQL